MRDNKKLVTHEDVNFNMDYRPYVHIDVTCPYCNRTAVRTIPMFRDMPKVINCWSCKKLFAVEVILYTRTATHKLVQAV